MNENRYILEIENLAVEFTSRKGVVKAVREVYLNIMPGESYALIGESGSGKSTIAFTILNYLAANGSIKSGRITFKGENLLDKSHEEMQFIRGDKIAMVLQDPNTSLNPSYTIGEQISETIRIHQQPGSRRAWELGKSFLEAVHLPDPERLMRQYPHQISGGQKQRVLIAQALSCQPALMILDEPTTALDVTTEILFLNLLDELRSQFDTAFLYITHDLGIVARIADRIGVMYAGQIVEEGSRRDIFQNPSHPYTRALMQSIPDIRSRDRKRLYAMPGRIPDLRSLPPGCIFSPRCDFVEPNCRNGIIRFHRFSDTHKTACLRWRDLPRMENTIESEKKIEKTRQDTPVKNHLEVDRLKSYYKFTPSFLSRLCGVKNQIVQAVDDVSFDVGTGETFGLVGESGCGKSTIGKAIVRLQELTAGRITFQGKDILSYSSREKKIRSEIQIIFQNPESSLNPRHKVKTIIGRPLKLFNPAETSHKIEDKCIELLEMVRLGRTYLNRFPHEMSGGEQQRVAIARAFATNPSFIVCDEVTSALDVSVQASVVNLLVNLQRRLNTSYLFISHDINIVRQISDYIGVMYLGRFVEIGNIDEIFQPPYHPYTRALLSAVSVPSLEQSHQKVMIKGVVPSAVNPPAGCRFHTRCPQKKGRICQEVEPPFKKYTGSHYMACHIQAEKLAAMEPIF